jgi:hypothetical protein
MEEIRKMARDPSTKPATQSSPSQEASKARLGSDMITRALRRAGVPVTMENWLATNYPEGVPDNWELEAEIPEELQAEWEAMTT